MSVHGATASEIFSTSSTRRRWALRAAAVLCAIVLPLLLLELALRMFGPFLPGNYDTGPYVQRHPVLGHAHVPNFRGWIKTDRFTVQLDFNRFGFRDSRTEYPRAADTFRILALGDSYIEAAQTQAPETVTSVLEGELRQSSARNVELVNAGVLGYGTGNCTPTAPGGQVACELWFC